MSTTETSQLQEMTTSYSEISNDSHSSPPTSGNRSSPVTPCSSNDLNLGEGFDKRSTTSTGSIRPDCLNLKNHEEYYKRLSTALDAENYQKAMNFLQNEGTVMNDGNMILFVAEDLENKIKSSSPMAKKGDSSSYSDSRNSTPSLYKQALLPQLPVLDHNVLNDLENEARKVATSVDSITENLAAILHSASALTVGCLETYRDAVCKTCDAVDYNIKSMYQLMAKCEELSKSMSGINKMSEKIKDIRKMVDLFENAMNS